MFSRERYINMLVQLNIVLPPSTNEFTFFLFPKSFFLKKLTELTHKNSNICGIKLLYYLTTYQDNLVS
jgi:hypothetical protein